MYDTMRNQYYWLHMVSDVQKSVRDCKSCERNRQKRKQQRKVQLFPATEAADFITINILGTLLKTKSGNQYIVVLEVRFSKLTKEIQKTKTTATAVSTIFLER